jgi:uncharacterized membrane protein
MFQWIKMKNKKALSQVVSTVLLIALAIAMIAGIWGTTQSFVKDRLDKTESCYGLFEQIKINDEYTCYDSENERVQISISRSDIDIDSLLVGISMETSSKTFVLSSQNRILEEVTNYPSNSTGVELPSKEGGKTYYVYGITSPPEKIELAPKINQNQCDVSDSSSQVDAC